MSYAKDIERIKQDNAELSEIINNSWNGIGIINLDSQFVYVNNAFSPILGYTRDELLKIKFEDLIIQKYKKAFETLVALNFEDKYDNSIKLTCTRKDGKEVHLKITINLMLNKEYFVINVSDITQTVSDHEIFDKYVIKTHTDLDGNIIKSSEAFCRLSGYDAQELLGKPYSIVKHDKRPKSLIKKLWDTIKSGEEFSGTILNKKKNGDDFWVDTVIKPIHNKYGDAVGYTAVMFDVTNEMILKENKKLLQKEVIDKEDKLKIMSETIRMIAHQWRQPLNTISIQVQNLLFDYELSDQLSETEQMLINKLKSITKNLEELSSIIDNFQHTSEIKETKTIISTQEIVNKAINLSSLDTTEISHGHTTDISFSTYPNELSQAIAHILDNAKDATHDIKPTIKFISFKTYKEDNNIIFEINDNGGHIPVDIIGDIFTPYFSTKKEKNSVGLSLYNCKTIIELHLKGKIEVFNLDTNIVMFKVTIPIEE